VQWYAPVFAILMVSYSAAAAAEDAVKAPFDREDCAPVLRLWRELAENGNAETQYLLGTLYHNGLGLGKDHGEAFRWYREAAN
jgi:TPR repeat protein